DGVTPHPKEQGPLGETRGFSPYSNTPVTALPQVRTLHSCDSVTGVTQPPSRLCHHLPHRHQIPPIPATRRQPLVADRPRRRPTSLSHPAAQLLIIPTRQLPGGHLTRDTVLTPLIHQRDDPLHNVLVLPSRDERDPHPLTPHTRDIPPSSHRPSASPHRSRRTRQHSTAVTVSGVDQRIWVLKQFPHALIAGRILLPARPRGRRIQIGALPRDPHP